MASLELSPLEQSILEWFAHHTTDSALAKQCRGAKAIHREHTGSGLFVELAVAIDLPPLENDISPNLVDPVIKSPQLETGAGVILFAKEGRIALLEIYSFGGDMPEQFIEYTLHAWEELEP
jgi:hypothetical protein